MNKLIDKEYTNEDYAMLEDFNAFYNAFQTVYKEVKNHFTYSMEDMPKMLSDFGIIYKEDIIQYWLSVERIGTDIVRPDGWIYSFDGGIGTSSQFYINYHDFNVLVNNLNLLNNIDYDNLKTIWNYQYYTDWESIDGDLEWED